MSKEGGVGGKKFQAKEDSKRWLNRKKCPIFNMSYIAYRDTDRSFRLNVYCDAFTHIRLTLEDFFRTGTKENIKEEVKSIYF